MPTSLLPKFLTFLLLILLAACGQYKRFTYLQKADPALKDSLYNKSFTYYKLQPADILSVNIQCTDENIARLFNKSSASGSYQNGSAGGGFYTQGYSIDIDGNITLPVIGKIPVGGRTIEEASGLIQKKSEEYIKDAQADVKLMSFKIYFLGEIGGSGMQTIYSDRANILEAIAMAGDINYNGNRRKVTIFRSYQQATRVIEVDLTKRELLSSPLYFLQPNDIVYVEPLKTTIFRTRLGEYSTIMSFVTSVVAMVVLITNLNNK